MQRGTPFSDASTNELIRRGDTMGCFYIESPRALGGFSIEDGDELRKVLSKKHKARQLRDYQHLFL
jgi:DNA polymerase III alpha subunit